MVRRLRLACLAGTAAAAAVLAACAIVQDLGSTGVGDAGTDGGGGAGDGSRSDDDARTPPDASSDGGTSDGAPVDPTKGPGPYGALPGGYCCTSDEECRFRHCRSVDGGPRMCLDECSSQSQGICDRPGIDFRCVTYTADFDSACEPPPGFACLDPSTFVRGDKTTGECCSQETSGLFGHECEANLCLALGQGPWVCTRFCEAGTDCPPDYRCADVSWRKECVPASSTYDCK